MIATPKAIILGIIARAINPFIKVHKKHGCLHRMVEEPLEKVQRI